ncbi:hypothetical protein Clocel_0260 [Clostridium cellulovorans 743B]|uniref:Uncharacterized protein n=1 Tax=Clostridium cellulovorans (strain ATCC 35296 / DSM 3052 / OCM 3 / 743B) TaxID=573061 RepID=D9SPJ5_CLOC7|nr:hypothetical protein Clocel_0260 [Clostridium cellulovorans 743B]
MQVQSENNYFYGILKLDSVIDTILKGFKNREAIDISNVMSR